MKATTEYEYVITVEVEQGTRKEEADVLRVFKKELMKLYGPPGGKVMLTGMRLR
jgi:hypothetical protein